MNKILIAGLGLCLTGLLHAAEPSSGTLTDNGEVIEFGGGPFAAANVSGTSLATGEPMCQDPVLPCDDFALTIDLPEEFIQLYPSALIRIVIGLDDPGGNAAEDYDLFLYDDQGNLVQKSTSEGPSEAIVLLANPGVQGFVVRTVPFTATASTYKGVIEVVPGEPAAPVAEEDADARSAFGGTRLRGGGSLGLFALALLVLGVRRRQY